ncbi:type II toxin-antitoxin system VapC family toxin [Tardiphaga alba]|uniref:Type II toxin-antitoxin system VapC family toxin n=1 Tax=Tardiphaga alba TaxID=340268 RepID=A0ABX8ACG2_9BRAD|nr:type II toxin-antitoxin system VapC family toxin [Tardiphaga alba]QUS41368.1 type II toxin-antitoxin system VapC family toxin [Tardiphaga alba]
MILPDTSVWIDHFRGGEKLLAPLLRSEDLLLHPFVIGELAVGPLPRRADTIRRLKLQIQAPIIDPPDVLAFIEQHALFGRGLSYVDVQLLASVHALVNTRLWTTDKRLDIAADQLGIAYKSKE